MKENEQTMSSDVPELVVVDTSPTGNVQQEQPSIKNQQPNEVQARNNTEPINDDELDDSAQP